MESGSDVGDALRIYSERCRIAHTEAIRRAPEFIFAYRNRMIAWIRLGDFEKAIADLGKAIRLDPENPNLLNERAWLRATCEEESFRDGRQAVADATEACELTEWNDPKIVDTLAAAYAESGNFEEAVKWQRKAVELAPAEMKTELSSRIELYQAGKAYRENPNE